MRKRKLSLTLFGSVAFAGLLAASHASAQQRVFDLPSEAAVKAVPEFARQAGLQIIAPSDALKGVRTPAIKGPMDARVALGLLLRGTGLVVAEDDGATITLRYERPSKTPSGGDPQPSENADPQTTVGEVVVTGKTGTQAVRSISGSVTGLTGHELSELGAQSLEDYLTLTPGVVFNNAQPGGSPAIIRGVASTTSLDQGQSSTGYFINDIPLTDPYFNTGIPDIDAFDVSNVTVLRGPQGTLFGSASLGGAINYQSALPNLRETLARVDATGEGSDRTGALGGAIKGMINLPIVEDKLAVRAVFVYRGDPGYINNVGTNQKNSNATTLLGGRIEATWKPTTDTAVNYFFLDQDEKTNDDSYASPAVGPYSKNTLFPELLDFRTVINSLKIDQDLHFATLTVTATYHQKYSFYAADVSSFFAPLFGAAGGPYQDGGPSTANGTTFEARLASPPTDKLAYVVGVFNDNTREEFVENIYAHNAAGFTSYVDTNFGPAFGDSTLAEDTAPNGYLFNADTKTNGHETAVFGEATYHLIPDLKLTFGGRYFWTSLSDQVEGSGLLYLLSTGVSQQPVLQGNENASGFTPKGSITWTPTDNFMAYALVSEGFRFGGPNTNPPEPGFVTPRTFGPDSLINYEIGFRTSWFDHKLEFDPTVFYIDWSNIQLRLATPAGFQYAANAGKSTNYGLEFTTVAIPFPGMRIENNLTYLSATLADDFNAGGGAAVVPKGSTLPGASKWNVSTTFSYRLGTLPGSPTVFLVQRYISSAPGIFGQDVVQGNFLSADARVTFQAGKTLQITPFITNITDDRGVTFSENSSQTGFRQYITRPRTFGITLDYQL